MHVLHVTSGLDPRRGGVPAALVGLALAQKMIGEGVAVIGSWTRGDRRDDFRLVEHLRAHDIEVCMIGPCHGPLSWHARLRPELAWAIADAGVVHIHALWEQIQHEAARTAHARWKPGRLRKCLVFIVLLLAFVSVRREDCVPQAELVGLRIGFGVIVGH